MKPSLGRVVLYTLTEGDAAEINRRREDWKAHLGLSNVVPGTGVQAHIGNVATAGDVCPADVVRIFDNAGTAVNLQVKLDGTDTYWATSRSEGEGPGFWCWPPRVGA